MCEFINRIFWQERVSAMGKALLIVNPSSGKEKGKTYQGKTEEVLKKRYDEVEVRLTEKAGDATELLLGLLNKALKQSSRWAETGL